MTSTRDLFARHNLRCTRQRVAVYESLCATKSHPTAEELFRMVSPRVHQLSLATVYNTLEALCRANLARKMPTTDGCNRYDANTDDHAHIRFRDSSEILDVPDHIGERVLALIPQRVLDEVSAELGVKIDGVSLQFHATRRNDADLN
jgi:Fe2+ or Zn2+ uptake regulation protein